jgi:hypothetical protein
VVTQNKEPEEITPQEREEEENDEEAISVESHNSHEHEVIVRQKIVLCFFSFFRFDPKECSTIFMQKKVWGEFFRLVQTVTL